MNSNTTGNSNTAIGFRAMHDNKGGDENTATGYLALWDNINGHDNTANGAEALGTTPVASPILPSATAALQLNRTGYG